jgi:DNA repair exonuclease SbcCD ATPase subunit
MNLAQDKLDGIIHNIEKLKNYREFLQNRVNLASAEESKLRHKADLYQKCSEIFKSWLEESIEKNITSISDLATNGLHHIIYDQNLEFKITQEIKYNRLSMKFSLEQEGVEGDPLDSFGGGAAVIVSLVLRLAVMARLGMKDLLILDESMVALANHYVPFAASFMRRLSEQTGINILMVTHNPEFLQQAHTAYEGTKDDSLKLKKIRTEGHREV